MTRAAFFGSPDFAIPCLEALHEIADIVCVFSQPDRPSGRGMKLRPPPVKARALELGLRVEQPSGIRTPEFAEFFRSLELDVAIVVAYGRILPPEILEAPRFGCLNIHASLLPKYRGAAPIQWAIANGEKETGVALMQMDEGLDTGPVFSERAIPIRDEHDAGSLAIELARLGADLLREDLPRILQGELSAEPQPGEGESYARLLKKSDAILDFRRGARELFDHARGMSPWPGAEATLEGGERLRFHRFEALEENEEGPDGAAPGTIVRASAEGIDIATGRGIFRVHELQESGKKRVSARDYIASSAPLEGRRFQGVEE